MHSIFWFFRLREGVNREEYEEWVRKVDYPATRELLKSVHQYRLNRIEKNFEGKIPYDYVEHMLVSSYDEYMKEQFSPEVASILKEWTKYVSEVSAVYAETIEE